LHLLTFQVSFCILKFNTCQFLRSLQTGALGNRLSRHGLATALLIVEKSELFFHFFRICQVSCRGPSSFNRNDFYVVIEIDFHRILSKFIICRQFHQHFTRSLYACRSQKHKKDNDNLTEFLRFWDLWAQKLRVDMLVKSTPVVSIFYSSRVATSNMQMYFSHFFAFA